MRASLGMFLLLSPLLAAGDVVAATSPAFTSAPPARDSDRECVVQFAPASAGTSVARARAEFSATATAAGFEVVANLGEAPESGGRVARGESRSSPFDLDPARVLLLRAPDARALGVGLAKLAGDPRVDWIEPVRARELCAFPGDGSPPDDPLLRDTRQWGLWNAGTAGVYHGTAGADIGIREAWRLSCGADEVRLALADTGVDPAHPDLQRVLADGSRRMARGWNVPEGSGIAWADSNGHGTAVAGVMAALTHDGPHFDSLGVAGVCGGDGRANLGCRLIPIKITAGGSGAAGSWDIAQAIVYAAGAGARALNLSFAGNGESRVERVALLYAITRGCVVVAAAGNRGATAPTAPQYPAAYAADGLCVAVGASDVNDRRAAFSSYGPGLDLLAPGLDIWTTAPTYANAFGARYPGYLSASGTSFAAPHVAGVIGLMAARRPDLADTDFQRLLRATARDLGAPGWDAETGWGRLDAAAAVRAAAPEFGLWHDERAAIVRPTGRFAPLDFAADGFGTFDRAAAWRGRVAELCEAAVTLTLPDSFADGAGVWPRVGGTMAVRGEFRLAWYAPWAEVAAREGRTITLHGYLYRVPLTAAPAGAAGTARVGKVARALGIEPEPDSADCWLPLPPDQARIGFTVFGPVERGRLAAATHGPPAPVLHASPNPARGPVRFTGPPLARVEILDLGGRRLREITLDWASGECAWDGTDAEGRRVRAGIYFARVAGTPSRGRASWARIAVLE